MVLFKTVEQHTLYSSIVIAYMRALFWSSFHMDSYYICNRCLPYLSHNEIVELHKKQITPNTQPHFTKLYEINEIDCVGFIIIYQRDIHKEIGHSIYRHVTLCVCVVLDQGVPLLVVVQGERLTN